MPLICERGALSNSTCQAFCSGVRGLAPSGPRESLPPPGRLGRRRSLHPKGRSRHICTHGTKPGIGFERATSITSLEAGLLALDPLGLVRYRVVQCGAVRPGDARGKDASLVDSPFYDAAVLLAGVGAGHSPGTAAWPQVSPCALPSGRCLDGASRGLDGDQPGFGGLGSGSRGIPESHAEIARSGTVPEFVGADVLQRSAAVRLSLRGASGDQLYPGIQGTPDSPA